MEKRVFIKSTLLAAGALLLARKSMALAYYPTAKKRNEPFFMVHGVDRHVMQASGYDFITLKIELRLKVSLND